jgi:methylmalonyl-CoA/ethylmalonyl-CoA epimerase
MSGEPQVLGLAHIGVAVRSIQDSMGAWSQGLGFRLVDTEVLDSMHLKIAFLKAGDVEIELLEPTSPESKVARFLERRGEGIHHLSFYVTHLETALARAEAQGLELIDRTPREGALGTRVAFLHPRSTRGVLIELCERRNS